MRYKVKIKHQGENVGITRWWLVKRSNVVGFQMHREDGPAVEYSWIMLQSKSFNHYCPYYINGKQQTWDYAIAVIIPKEKKPVKSLTYNTDSIS